jgi:hypothetical protein
VTTKQGVLTPLPETNRHRVWLTIADVLADLGIDRGTFDHWRRRGVRPRMKQLPNRTWRIRGDWYDGWLLDLPDDTIGDDTLGVAA